MISNISLHATTTRTIYTICHVDITTLYIRVIQGFQYIISTIRSKKFICIVSQNNTILYNSIILGINTSIIRICTNRSTTTRHIWSNGYRTGHISSYSRIDNISSHTRIFKNSCTLTICFWPSPTCRIPVHINFS